MWWSQRCGGCFTMTHPMKPALWWLFYHDTCDEASVVVVVLPWHIRWTQRFGGCFTMTHPMKPAFWWFYHDTCDEATSVVVVVFQHYYDLFESLRAALVAPVVKYTDWGKYACLLKSHRLFCWACTCTCLATLQPYVYLPSYAAAVRVPA